MEAAVEHRAAVHELPPEDVGAGVVQPHGLSIRGNEEQHSAPRARASSAVIKDELRELLTSEGARAFYLVPRGDEQVIAVVGEPEVGDPVGRRARELAPRRRRQGGRHLPGGGWLGEDGGRERFF